MKSMILSTHFIAGAAVASKTDNPFLLLASTIMIHFILDVIPHWQYVYTAPELKKRKIQLYITADIIVGPLLVAAFIGKTDIHRFLWLTLGGILCMLPDFFTVLSVIFPRSKLLKKMLDFHEYVQKYAHQDKMVGIVTQLAIIIIAIGVLNY
ncbi:MAG: hypothetical protein V1690_01030 [Candidatus Moraniibacteriota bacterium]